MGFKEWRKECVECGEMYDVKGGQVKQSKYCSQRCNWRARARRDRKTKHKGGYNRATYIRLWLHAININREVADCHYCNKQVTIDNFQIDHKVPRSKLDPKERKTTTKIDNLVVSCASCNAAKGDGDYEEFKKKMSPAMTDYDFDKMEFCPECHSIPCSCVDNI